MFKLLLSVLMIFFISSISHAQIYWGAFAIDPTTGIAGGAQDSGSRSLAEGTAMKSCNLKHANKPNKCQPVYYFNNTCAAIAWSPSTKRWGAGHHIEDDGRAGTRAINNCGVNDCRTVLEFCTSRIIF